MGALLVGVSFAKAFAYAIGKPLIDVNHMQAHILAHFIEEPKPDFPFICLTVSGGHTQLVLVRDHLEMEVIGQTLDDAVGEAFDKTAKLLGLPYPGGPLIDRYAQQGDPHAYSFPLSDMPALDYSFSGIKTAVMYFLRDQLKANPNFIVENLRDICASVQYTLVTMLVQKLRKAASDYGITDIAIAGGVAANSGLRNAVDGLAGELNGRTFIPKNGVLYRQCRDDCHGSTL